MYRREDLCVVLADGERPESLSREDPDQMRIEEFEESDDGK